MKNIQRLASIGIVAAAAVSLAACGNSEQPASGGKSSAPMTSPSSSSPSSSSSSAAGGSGVTTAKDVFGPGCAQVPKTGPGSVQGMISDPVGTAASNNPLLKTLTQAVTKAGLVPTLNKADAKYTVFAPADPAFAAVPKASLTKLLADKSKLTQVLTEHVLPMRMDEKGLLAAKTGKTVAGMGDLTFGGSGDNMTVTDPTGVTAKVLCGNVPTANATVFVIDKVLTPKAS